MNGNSFESKQGFKNCVKNCVSDYGQDLNLGPSIPGMSSQICLLTLKYMVADEYDNGFDRNPSE